MEYNEFIESLSADSPPERISSILKSLWHDAKGNWAIAHEIVQGINSGDASLVHAYLHRKEGDLSNARYWYSRAGEKEFQGSLDDEWKNIVQVLLVKNQTK